MSDLPELSGAHVVSGEEAVSGVPQVLTELLIQLLQHTCAHARSIEKLFAHKIT